MLTALLLSLALSGQTLPPADDTPDTVPASAPTVEARSWSGIKAAFTTAPVFPLHRDADDERGLR